MTNESEDWKHEAGIARRAQESCVVLVETEDRKRTQEVLEYVSHPDERFVHQFIGVEGQRLETPPILVTPWKTQTVGLLSVSQEENEDSELGLTLKPYGEDGSTSGYSRASSGGGNAMQLPAALHQIDQILRESTSVVVFANVTLEAHANMMDAALQSWAYDPDIISKLSTCFVVTPRANLFNITTRKWCIFAQPPLSTYAERKAIFEENARIFGGLKYEEYLIRASAGLTLHDTETAVIESYWRYGDFHQSQINKVKVDRIRKLGYELRFPEYGFEAVGGYTSLINHLKELVILMRNPRVEEWGIPNVRGIMLFGPPENS